MPVTLIRWSGASVMVFVDPWNKINDLFWMAETLRICVGCLVNLFQRAPGYFWGLGTTTTCE